MRSLEFDAAAFDDLAWGVEQERRQALRIIRLIRDVQRDPLHGVVQNGRVACLAAPDAFPLLHLLRRMEDDTAVRSKPLFYFS